MTSLIEVTIKDGKGDGKLAGSMLYCLGGVLQQTGR